MARVGDELTHPALTGLTGGQCRSDVVEHPVECESEPADFSVGVGVGAVDAQRQGDLASIQWQVGDGAGSGGHPIERRQGAADDQHARGGRDRQCQRGHHREDQRHPDQGLVDAPQTQPDHQIGSGLTSGRGDHPVGAQPVEVAGLRVPASSIGGELACRHLGQGIPVTAPVQRTGLSDGPFTDDSRDHADRLARGVEELRSRPGSGHHRAVVASRRRRWPVVHHRRPLGDMTELAVEFADQVGVQREFGCRSDSKRDRDEQGQLPGE